MLRYPRSCLRHLQSCRIFYYCDDGKNSQIIVSEEIFLQRGKASKPRNNLRLSLLWFIVGHQTVKAETSTTEQLWSCSADL